MIRHPNSTPDGHTTDARRILCVTSSFPRWAGDSTTPFVWHLAQDLQGLGWSVDVLAPHAPDAAITETLGGVRVERFRYLWPEGQQTVCYQGGALVNLRQRPWNRLKLAPLVAAQWAAVARRLATGHYDLLHSHWILPQGFVGMMARPFGRIPHVVTVHGSDLFGLRGALMDTFKRRVLHQADAVTVNSCFTEAAVRQLAPETRGLHRIPMGVAIRLPDAAVHARASELRRRYRKGQGPLLVFVGRLIEEKGPEDLIRAIDFLGNALPDVTALIVGDGPERRALEDLVAQLLLTGRIEFPGWIDPSELGAWLAAADCFVGPSRRAPNGGVEAQGLTFIEAMAAGTPVIATRLGGIPDAVIHETTGLLVDERAPEQIAAAVQRLVADPRFAVTLAEQGRRHAVGHFSRAASAGAFGELFKRLIDRERERV